MSTGLCTRLGMSPRAKVLPRALPQRIEPSGSASDELTSRILKEAIDAASQGREIEAGHLFVEHFDSLFLAGDFDAARRALARIDPQQFPPKVLSSVMMVTMHARGPLGDARLALLTRIRRALAEKWQLAPDLIESLFRRLS